MRTRFDQELRDIQRDVVTMGTHAGEMIRLAVRAAIEHDTVLASQVVAMDDDLDRQVLALTEHVVTTLLREAPVARDLLFLTCTLSVIGEVEKVGDDATKLARRVGKLRGDFPAELRRSLSEMDQQARTNFLTAIRLSCDYDDKAASNLVDADDQVDFAFKASREILMEMVRAKPEDIRQFLRLTEMFRALEHVSDRAVDIAKNLRRFHQQFPGSREPVC